MFDAFFAITIPHHAYTRKHTRYKKNSVVSFFFKQEPSRCPQEIEKKNEKQQ